MAVKTILSDISEAPESLRDEYQQREVSGKTVFVLNVEGVDDHPTVVNLKSAFERVKADKQALSRELGELKSKVSSIPDDFDPDEWDRMRSEDEARRNDPAGKDVRAQIEAAVAAARAGFEKSSQRIKAEAERQVAEAERRAKELEGELNAGLVGGGLRQALLNAGVKRGLIDAAVAKFERDVEVVVEDGRRIARMKPELGGSDIATYFGNWASSDEAKDFIDPARGDDENGSRNTRATGENPFTKGGWSKTAQAAALKTDRTRAERLAKAAGFKSLDAALSASAPND
jgi:hypothetical protein